MLPWSSKPVRKLLLDKYGHRFRVSSFRELKDIIMNNSDYLTKTQQEVMKLRFNFGYRGTRISSILGISLQSVYSYEQDAMLRVFYSYKFSGMRKADILNMTLFKFSKYMPYFKGHLSKARYYKKKIKDLVKTGSSAVITHSIGPCSYENLRKLLLQHRINLEVYEHGSHYRSAKEKYVAELQVRNLGDVKKIFSLYKQFLKPSEVKVVRMRLKNKSLEDVGRSFGFRKQNTGFIEDDAIEKLKFYSTKHEISDLSTLKCSEFIKFIPPADNKAVRLKKSFSKMKDFNLGDVVSNPELLISNKHFGYKSYEFFRSVLADYDITIPAIPYFQFSKKYYG